MSISRQIINLSIPIIISQMSRVLMSLADMSMVSHLGTDALAATGMGSLILWIAMSSGIGLRTAVQTVSARRFGEKKIMDCGDALLNGIIIAILLSLPIVIFGVIYSSIISELLLMDLNVISYCSEYIRIGFFSVIFVLISFAFQGFYTSIGNTKIHMIITILSNLLNVYLNAALIFGSTNIMEYFHNTDMTYLGYLWNYFDFPSLGVKGAALATLISHVFTALCYMFYLKVKFIKSFFSAKYKFISSNINKLIKIGTPISIQEVITMLGFAIFYKIINQIGTLELAASEVILNIAHASFMPAVGVGMASAAILGKYMGENDIARATATIYSALKWSFLIMGTMGSLFIIFPYQILSFFISSHELINMSIPCLRLIGVVQYFDAIGLTLFFILTGAGNTKFPALVNISLCWVIFLPLAYILSIIFNMGLIGAWIAFSIWVILFSIIMIFKVRAGSWKNIKI